MERTRTEAEELSPDSPQGVIANEVYPYPPRFNQRMWRGATDVMQDAVSN